jgi:hypothetical protein
MSRLLIAAVLAVSGLSACAPVSRVEGDQRAAMKFDRELAGLVPGRPQSCLPSSSRAALVAARGPTLLFREGSTVYANSTGGGCSSLADGQDTLVTENFGSSLCRGSLAKVVDLRSGGFLRGTCVLGDFTPYRRP